MPPFLSAAVAEFAYEAQTEAELTIRERDPLWVLEIDEDEWYKVKLRVPPPTGPDTGLVPASYLSPEPPLRTVIAIYQYVPTDPEAEEIQIEEGERLTLHVDEDPWVGVTKGEWGEWAGAGFVPATYVAEEGSEEANELLISLGLLSIGAAAGAAANANVNVVKAQEEYQSPDELSSSTAKKPGQVKTWNVTEVDKKKKKKKGTLGIGNGAVFFASDSDKTPVQQHKLSDITDIETEKQKHIILHFDDQELHFSIPSKDEFDEIIEAIEAGRGTGGETPASASPVRKLIPPPPALDPAPSPPARPSVSFASAVATIPASSSGFSKQSTSNETNAVALYEFAPVGNDEVPLDEGVRLFVITGPGASEDEDWVKVRLTDGREGLVPTSFIQMDDNYSSDGAEDEAKRLADEEALAQQLKRDKQRQLEKEKERERQERERKVETERLAKEERRRREDEKERKRHDRLSQAPKAKPIPIPSNVAHDTSEESEEDKRERARERDKERDRADRREKHHRKNQSVTKPSPLRTRTWQDSTGKFQVEAEFLGMSSSGTKLRLHKVNGVIIEVPLSKMSEEDKVVLRRLQQNKSKDKEQSDEDNKPLDGVQKNLQSQREKEVERAEKVKEREKAREKERKARSNTDWFDLFLAAGCDLDDCTRYTRNFEREKIEESIVSDLEASNLRSLGLREGDIIRVLKAIKDKYGAPSVPTKDPGAGIVLGPTPPAPNLFTNDKGGLKTTRRGRPTREKTEDTIDPKMIASASQIVAQKTGNASSTGIQRSASPLISMEDSSSATPQTAAPTGGFEDDAWQNRPVSKPAPTPIQPPAELPKSAPAVSPAPATAIPPTTPASEPPRPASAASAGSGLTYNDGLLAQLGIQPGGGPVRSPSAPIPSQPTGSAILSQPTGSGLLSQPTGMQPGLMGQQTGLVGQQTGMGMFYNPNAPRGPALPIPVNQGLLNPMIPTKTGLPNQNMFMNQPMQMQPTGFVPSQSPSLMQPAQTGFTPSMMLPQQTGFIPSNPTPSLMQSQPTGFAPNQPAFSQPAFSQPSPIHMSGGAPIQFNPMPPASLNQVPVTSTASEQFQPENIFASMKDGSFGGKSLGPQSSNKYDALRTQPTGFTPQLQMSMQTQPTGFPGQMMAQPTGFPMQGMSLQGQQGGMMPQQQGMFPQQANQFGQFGRQF